jgi:hypothetical protein
VDFQDLLKVVDFRDLLKEVDYQEALKVASRDKAKPREAEAYQET